MKRVLKIFVHDLVGLSRNIFALIIAVGLCIIPSLYAWFNIYSNWDPYANTSSIKVAVVSQDAGYKNSDGKNVNMGDEVLDTLRKNKGLGWQILGTYDEAIDGVKSGKYYAAIVLGEDFSKNMFDFIDNGLVHPSVTYYENEKKNAVASKITQSGKSTLQENINTQFVDTVVQTAMGSTDGILSEDKDILSGVTESLKKLNSNLSGYNTTITAFVNSYNALQGTLNQVKNEIPQVQQALLDGSDTTQKIHEQTSAAADEYIQKIDELSSLIRQTSKELSEQIHKLIDSVQNNAGTDEIIAGINSAQNLLDALMAQNDTLAGQLQEISQQLGGVVDDEVINAAVASITQLENVTKALLEQAKVLVSNSAEMTNAKLELLKIILGQCETKIDELDKLYQDSLRKSVDSLRAVIGTTISSIGTSLTEMSQQMSGLSAMMGSLMTTVDGMNIGLDQTGIIIKGMTEKITTLTQKLDSLNGDEKFEMLAKALSQDPVTYGEFLSSPVKVSTHQVYETANYGSAVAPFYTTLALWVGGLLLTALIKVHPDKDELTNGAKSHELFFGRYLLFFVLGQVQAVITVLGDLYLLKIQCLHKGLFMLAACFVSFVFTLLIYTLTVSFGDIGKALAVVMVVIQIAGSSGTYPIELLPVFFQKVYIYFPFPYAINAMRETISGMYSADYAIYIGELLIFVAGSLALGLFIRKPFMKLNHYMHERMHDTDMM